MDIGGLGTISARSKTMELLEFIVNDKDKQPTLKLTITPSKCVLQMRDKSSGKYEDVPNVVYPKQPAAACLNTLSKTDLTVYWISVDRSNKRFRYGQHLTNFSLTYLDVGLDGDKPFPNWMDTLKSTDVHEDGHVSHAPPSSNYWISNNSPDRKSQATTSHTTRSPSPWTSLLSS